MARGRRYQPDVEEIELMFGELATELDRKGKLTPEDVVAADPRRLLEERKKAARKGLGFVRSVPLIGWPLTIVFWLLISLNLYEIVRWSWEQGVFEYNPTSLDDLYQLPIILLSGTNCLAFASIIGIFALFRCRRWGFFLYLIATLLRALFLDYHVDQGPVLAQHFGLLFVLIALLRMRWDHFD